MALLKMDGKLRHTNKIDVDNQNNNIADKICERKLSKYDNIFLWCNLISDSYVNNRKLNSIYRFRPDFDESWVFIEPSQLVYHTVINISNKITIKLVDNNNELINFNDCDLFIELIMKEIKK